MLIKPAQDQRISPTRLLEMLSDRFGASEASANSSIKLARVAPEEEQAMGRSSAEAILAARETAPAVNAARGDTQALIRRYKVISFYRKDNQVDHSKCADEHRNRSFSPKDASDRADLVRTPVWELYPFSR